MIETFWKWVSVSAITCAEFFIFTGIVFLVAYVWKKKKFWYAKIQERYPDNKQIAREIKYCIISLLIAGALVVFVNWSNRQGWTLMYKPLNKYGYFYYFLSFFLMVAIHDTYFYWGHRLLHWKKIFKYVHITHHLSTNPTPFSAYAFHPVEGFIQVAIIPLVAFTVPHHVSIITAFFIYATLTNVAGHCGFEFVPKWFTSHKIFKWHNAATHHNMHHRYFSSNYGLYFNFWDRIMKTNHPNYEAYHEKLAIERAEKKLASKTEHLPTVKIDEPKVELTEVA